MWAPSSRPTCSRSTSCASSTWRRRPRDVDFVEGSIADPEALARALDGTDTFITMVMKGGQGGFTRDHTPQLAIDNYTVNCLGLHLLLLTAHDLGIHCGIHTGTMSQHHRGRDWYPGEDHVPLDGPNVYGLTKGLAEGICRYFAREFRMNLAVFRITGPSTRQRFIERRNSPPVAGVVPTDEEDLPGPTWPASTSCARAAAASTPSSSPATRTTSRSTSPRPGPCSAGSQEPPAALLTPGGLTLSRSPG